MQNFRPTIRTNPNNGVELDQEVLTF